MKKYLLIALIAFAVIAKAQVALEHTYDSAGSFIAYPSQAQLYIIKLEVDSEKYVFVDRINKAVKLYNLNHTPWKVISFAGTIDLDPNSNAQEIMYISQHLFNTDDKIEFLYADINANTPDCVTQIINEDGNI
jgi:hypothetical protein